MQLKNFEHEVGAFRKVSEGNRSAIHSCQEKVDALSLKIHGLEDDLSQHYADLKNEFNGRLSAAVKQIKKDSAASHDRLLHAIAE